MTKHCGCPLGVEEPGESAAKLSLGGNASWPKEAVDAESGDEHHNHLLEANGYLVVTTSTN